MSVQDEPSTKPFQPLLVAVACSLLAVTLWYFHKTDDLLLLGVVLLSWCCGRLLNISRTLAEWTALPRVLSQLLVLARDQELADLHLQLLDQLVTISQQPDPIFRQLATPRLESLLQQAETLSGGSIEYSSTESWRIAYEELLRSPGLHSYHSIAYIESAHYWQDGPGQLSTQLNLQLQESRTLSIERIAILADHLWPEGTAFPVEPLHKWLDEQYRHGILVRLIRESAVASEPELLTDCGIYGNRAAGTQLADPAGRTIRFLLSFDYDQVKKAEAIWQRLSVYAISYRDLLDQQG